MKEKNNIAIALDALGEKIASLELSLACAEIEIEEYKKTIAEKDKRINELEAARLRFPQEVL